MPASTLRNAEYSTTQVCSAQEFRHALWSQLREIAQGFIQEILLEEMTTFLNASPYARSTARNGQRNGFQPRSLNSVVGPVSLRIPRDRQGQFHSQVFDRYQRNDPRIVDQLTDMFFRGVSEEAVGQVAEPLLGVRPSASTVSRMAHNLEEQCTTWRSRPLQEHYLVLYIDGVYFSILHEEKSGKQPVLAVLGVDKEGRKEVLGVYPVGEESTESYTAVLEDLKKRGVQRVDLLISDGDFGLIRAVSNIFPTSQRQRCLTHKFRNVLCRIPKKDKKAVAVALKEIFDQKTEEEARERLAAFVERYRIAYPEAVKSLLEDIDACFTFFQFGDESYQRHIRSTNCLEGLFNTIRLRTNKMAAFRNEASCSLMLYAIIQTVRFRRIDVPDSILHRN